MGMVLLYSRLMEPLTITEAARDIGAELKAELGPSWDVVVTYEENFTPYTPVRFEVLKHYMTKATFVDPNRSKEQIERFAVDLFITEERVLSNVVNPKIADENILIDRGTMRIGSGRWDSKDYSISRGGVRGLRNSLQKIVNRIETVLWLLEDNGTQELTDVIVKAVGRRTSNNANTTRKFERSGIQCELDLSHLFTHQGSGSSAHRDRFNAKPSLLVTLRAKSRIIGAGGQFKWLQIGQKNLITYGSPADTLESAKNINEWIDRCLTGFEAKEQRFIERKRRDSCSQWRLSEEPSGPAG